MVLVDYSSDNSNDDQVNTTSTNPQQGVSSRSANLGTKSQQNDSDHDDDQEDDYDPQDAFGINKLSSTTSTTAAVNSKSTSATTVGASTTVQSAPQVVINVSLILSGHSIAFVTPQSSDAHSVLTHHFVRAGLNSHSYRLLPPQRAHPIPSSLDLVTMSCSTTHLIPT